MYQRKNCPTRRSQLGFVLFGARRALLGNKWTPLKNFAGGKKGLWVATRNWTNDYQDSAGTTPVTTIEQPMGMLMDRARGLALGAEQVVNGNFSSGLTGWTADVGWTIAVGSATRTTSTADWFYQTIDLSSISTVLVQVTVSTNTTGAGVTVRIGATNFSDTTAKTGIYSLVCTGNANGAVKISSSTAGAGNLVITNVSVKQYSGIHLLQATAPSRPKSSQRVNLLTATDAFQNAAWLKLQTGTGVTPVATDNYAAAPDGTATASRIQLNLGATPATALSRIYQNAASPSLGRNSLWIRTADASTKTIYFTSAAVGELIVVNGTWQQITRDVSSAAAYVQMQFGLDGSLPTSNTADLLVWHPDCRTAGNALAPWPAYQRVTSTTDYDTAGFPFFAKFDGVDDGLVSPTFAAGTLGAAMDAYIVLRRNSASGNVLFANATGTRLFGFFNNGSGAAASQVVGAASTYLVNDVAVPGGTATTAGQLEAALPVGAWNVLQIHDLDLHLFDSIVLSNNAGFHLNGDFGELLICEAGTNRAQNLRYLANEYGVTLP